jgi:hypothetical protein
MTAFQGWILIGLLVLIVLGIVGIGAEIEYLPLRMAYLQSIIVLSCPPAAFRHPGRSMNWTCFMSSRRVSCSFTKVAA